MYRWILCYQRRFFAYITSNKIYWTGHYDILTELYVTYQCHQHMENAYPGSNILVVTLTNGESKRVEAQPDEETLKEAMEVLRDMFGPDIPNATDILVPRWWNNRFQRGSYSNYPIISDNQLVNSIRVIISYSAHWICTVLRVFFWFSFNIVILFQAPVAGIFFTGEHTSERFNGYVHGGYLAGVCRVFLWLEAFLVYIRLGTYINGILCILSARLFIDFTGIDTGKAVVEKIRKDSERNNSETQNFLLEPLLALTLTQTEAMSSLHKCDIPKQLYLSGKLGIPEAILWLHGPKLVVDNDDDEIMTYKTQGQMGLTPEIELSKPSVKQNAGDGDGAGPAVSRMWVIRKNMRKSCMYLSSKVQLLQHWIRGNMISFKAHVKMVWLSA